MICPGCSTAADNGDLKHGEKACDWPMACPCKHGRVIEQDPDGDPDIPVYVDALPPDDPRRLLYERQQRRAVDRNSLAQEGVAPYG
jgi:hypothetical protein